MDRSPVTLSSSLSRARRSGRALVPLLALGALAGPARATPPAPTGEPRCRPAALAVVLDTSASSASRDELARVASAVIDAAPDATRTTFVAFGDGARVVARAPAGSQAHRAAARAAVARLATNEPWTDLGAGLELALSELGSEPGAARTIVLVSDGVISLPDAQGREDAARAATERATLLDGLAPALRERHVQVHALTRSGDRGALALLSGLSARTLGRLVIARDADDLVAQARMLEATLCLPPPTARAGAATTVPTPILAPVPIVVAPARADPPTSGPTLVLALVLPLLLLAAGAGAAARRRLGTRTAPRAASAPTTVLLPAPGPARDAATRALTALLPPSERPTPVWPRRAPDPQADVVTTLPEPPPPRPQVRPEARVFVAVFGPRGDLHAKVDLRPHDDLWLFGPRGLVSAGHERDAGAMRLAADPASASEAFPPVILTDVPRGGFVDVDRGVAYDRGTRLRRNNVRFTWARDPSGHVFEVIWK